MSADADIRHRMTNLDTDNSKLNPVERSRKLKSLQVTHNKLFSRLGSLNKQRNMITKEMEEAKNQIRTVDQQIKELENDNDPIITEHAYLRYLERFVGIDLTEIHEQILSLAEGDMFKSGNTIVTVFPTKDDHFNLAGREDQA